MFKKMFAKMGIGSAKVDAVLDTDHFAPGGRVEGRVKISGGKVEQEISAIDLKLMTLAKSEGEEIDVESGHTLASYRVAEPFVLKPGDELEMPFSFDLHPETPITVVDVAKNKCKVWLETSLDIDMALDPTDRDYLNIHPSPIMHHVMNAMTNNGFKMVKADVEVGYINGAGFQSQSGCYQELEYKPPGFGFSIQEVELSFIPEAHRLHVLIEVDRTFGGDGYRSLTLDNSADYATVEAQLKAAI